LPSGLKLRKIAEFSRFHLQQSRIRKSVAPEVGGAIRVSGTFQGKGCLMNKNDLIAAVAERTGMSKAGAGQAVDATFDAITASLKSGQEVKIIGFGNFTVAKRAASMGRNPRTGEAIKIAASKTPKFKAGKGLKDAVNH
jgi:DNA-binding protein HU-beta